MAEKLKDAEDRLLESMFQSAPIADNGFSRRVVTRIRRRLWVRRLSLPVAMVIGGSIAIKPLSQLVVAATRLFDAMPQKIFEVQPSWLPQTQGLAFGASLTQTIVLGAMLLLAGILAGRMLSE